MELHVNFWGYSGVSSLEGVEEKKKGTENFTNEINPKPKPLDLLELINTLKWEKVFSGTVISSINDDMVYSSNKNLMYNK